jgi:hypothetical protein
MKKKTMLLILSTLLTFAAPIVLAGPPGHLKEDPAYVYVTSQEKYYRTIVPVSPDKGLPVTGPFQLLEMAGPSGLQTEFGPGDQGYVGGRWWVDVTGDGHTPDDLYFLCPLLGPALDTVPQ